MRKLSMLGLALLMAVLASMSLTSVAGACGIHADIVGPCSVEEGQ